MSLLVYPVFDSPVELGEPETTGEFLAANFRELDEIAEANAVTPFTAFTDSREVPEVFAGSADELKELLGPCDDWFEPAEGRQAFGALVKVIRDQPEVAKRLNGAATVVAELEDLIRMLGIADGVGARFRLELS